MNKPEPFSKQLGVLCSVKMPDNGQVWGERPTRAVLELKSSFMGNVTRFWLAGRQGVQIFCVSYNMSDFLFLWP